MGHLCGSLAPLEAPSLQSRGPTFGFQRHFGHKTFQSVILSTPSNGFCWFLQSKRVPRVLIFVRLGAPGVHLDTPSDRLWAITTLTFQLLCCFLEFPGADQSKCDFEQRSMVLALLRLTWDPSVADLGQPGTQLFDFLVPWGRLGATKTSF